jgi:hypothetical protein
MVDETLSGPEHMRNVDSVLSINVTFKGISRGTGAGEGPAVAPVPRKLCGALLSAWTSLERQFSPTGPLKFSKMTRTWPILLGAKLDLETLQTRADTPCAGFLCARMKLPIY